MVHQYSVAIEHMDVSKNRGTPKWMVKIMGKPIKMDDLGVPLFWETPICKGKKHHTRPLPPELEGFDRKDDPRISLATFFIRKIIPSTDTQCTM